MNRQLFLNKYLNRISSIEFVISEKCQNACKYCYRVQHHNKSKISHITIEDFKLIINNLKHMFGNDILQNRTIELFGGDPVLNYDILINIFEILKLNEIDHVVLPTNARLIQELTFNDIRKLIKSLKSKVFFSLSVDSPHMDNNRQLSKYGKMLCYNIDIDYDYIFKLTKQFPNIFSFHPMLSFNSISNWKKTVDFFYNKFKHIPYLLEVRHALSKSQSIEAVQKLIEIRQFGKTLPEYKEITNFANSISPSICPRGLGCSALTTLCIMPNGNIPFCHRLIESPYVFGNIFKQQFNKEMAISYTSLFDFKNLTSCINCNIRTICPGQCLGANFEYWGDAFIMNPTICDFFKLKMYGMMKNFKSFKNAYSRHINFDNLLYELKLIFGDDIDDKI